MLRSIVKEEYAIVLDFLQHGHAFDSRPGHLKTPIAQAIGRDHFVLLELVPKKGVFLQPLDEVYIGEGKREQVHHIYGKVAYDKLTETAKAELVEVVAEAVKKNEKKFIEFFNKAGPISTRMHQIELIPGVGKKHMWDILEKRQEKEFDSFEDIKKRVKLMSDPEKAVVKRIIEELKGNDRYKVFIER